MAKKPEPFNNPFSKLKLAAKEKPRPPSAPAAPKSPPPAEPDDSALFLEAVGVVAPVKSAHQTAPPPPPRSAAELRIPTEEAESLARLAELVSGEGPFDLADSDEFIEGSVRGLEPKVMRRLRAGDYASQAHLDLHGRTKEEAKLALEQFVTRARVAGHRCVLVVTGRGLHSKDQVPVLKTSVQAWLSRGRSAKHVLAFCSARAQDGGAGAVYVLLRR